MATKVEIHEIEPHQTEFQIEHKLNTLTPGVTVWQNGYTVNATVRALDNSHVVMYNTGSGGTLVLTGDPGTKTSRRSSTDGKDQQDGRVTGASSE